MKKANFTSLIAMGFCFLAMLFTSSINAQAPAGSVNVDIVVTGGAFPGEVSWTLSDAGGAQIAAGTPGTTSAVLAEGTDFIFQGFDAFGDGWNGAAADIIITEDGSAGGCDALAGNNALAGYTFDTGMVGPATTFTNLTCPACELQNVPADIIVDAAPGTCTAAVVLANPTASADCISFAPLASFDFTDATGWTLNAIDGAANWAIGPNSTTDFAAWDGDLLSYSDDDAGLGSINTIEAVSPAMDATGATTLLLDYEVLYNHGGFGGAEEALTVDVWDGAAWQNVATYQSDMQPFVAESLDITAFANAALQVRFTYDDGDDWQWYMGIDNLVVSAAAAPAVTNSFNGTEDASGDYPVGTTEVVFTTFDASGIPVTASVNVTVNDVEAPVLDCPADMLVDLGPGECNAVVSYTVTATDNCPVTGAASALETGFAATHFGAGNMFNVTNTGTEAIQISSFDVNLFAGTGTSTIEVYYTTTATGFQGLTGDASAWTLLGSASATATANNDMTNVAIGGLVLNPGESKGLYVTSTTNSLLGTITNIGGSTLFTDGVLEIDANNGTFNDYPFGANGAPFIWNGNINYSVFSNEFAPVQTAGLASGETFPIGVTTISYEATDDAGNISMCSFDIEVTAFSGQTSVLAANDHVQVSLDEDGLSEVTTDMVLEGGPYGCYDDYLLTRSPECDGCPATLPGDPGSGPNAGFIFVNCNDVGQTITVTITDPATGNSAWSTVTVEDKLAPTIMCSDAIVSCTAGTDPDVPTNITDRFAATPAPIPTNGTAGNADFEIEVELPADAAPSNLNISLDIQHSWVGDLTATITTPEGTVLDLFARPGNPDSFFGCAGDDMIVTLDDEAALTAADLDATCEDLPAIAGTFQAISTLNSVLGEDLNGIWVLSFNDAIGGDGGNLVAASVEIDYIGLLGVPEVSDNCEIESLTFVETTTEGDCAGDAATITRVWTVTDASGNSASCEQTITVERPTLADVDFPSNFDDLDLPSLDCANANGWDTNGNGYPDVSETGVPTINGEPIVNGDICGLTYSQLGDDVVIDICATSFKVRRKWLVIDWCTGDEEELNQLIKVLDSNGPSVLGPQGAYTFNASSVTADANGSVELVLTIDGVSYTGSLNNQQPLTAVNAGNLASTLNSLDNVASWIADGNDVIGGAKFSTYTLTANANVITLQDNNAIIDIDVYSANGCLGNVTIPALNVIGDDCSGLDEAGSFTEIWTLGAGELLASIAGNGGVISGIEMTDVFGGNAQYTVRHLVADNCGNQTECTYDVELNDRVAPVAVCDEITDLSLTNGGATGEGCATIFAADLDDGSHDNCGQVYFLVGKPAFAGFAPTSYSASAEYCCSDIGENMATLLVLDFDPTTVPGLLFNGQLFNTSLSSDFMQGHYNTCMIVINVEDKLPPVNTSCPANATIDCDTYLEDYSAAISAGDYSSLDADFGVASFYDNCGFTPTSTTTVNIDNCASGTITRTFTATDADGNTASCSYTITVEHVSDWEVQFPADVPAQCTAGTLPDFGEPNVFNDECELIGISYEDTQYDVVPDACYKIVREYSVINWCVFDQFGADVIADPQVGTRRFADGGDGFITYQQVIKVTDNEAPTFTIAEIDGCIINATASGEACMKDITLPFPANMDDCSNEFEVNIAGDLGSFNDISGAVTITDVAPGDYTVYYNVTDECGNFTSESVTINVTDCKKPTPYCVNGVIFEIMQTGMVEIWASDLDAGSFDNCPGDLLVYFNNNPALTNLTFDCTQLGENNVELWIEDAAGNKDYCITQVYVQDNMSACGDAAIAGTVATEEDVTVEGTSLDLNGGLGNQVTGQDGSYNFNQLPVGGDYSVTPMLDNNYTNGVTTYDLVLISKHILGVTPFDSPYKHIAADANNSGSVTTYDMVVLRRLILLIDTELANNTSWRFVDAAYAFPSATNPWLETFPEVLNYNNLESAINNANFVGVKIGDVNGSANANSGFTNAQERTNENLVLTADNATVTAGETVTVEFTTSDLNVEGFQFTLNHSNLELVEIVEGVASAENFGIKANALTASWNGKATNEVLFTAVFTATADVTLSEVMSINSRLTAAEAYNANGEAMDVNLEFNVTSGFELFQNTPNPSNGVTTISFNLPTAAAATLTINDINGKVISVINVDGAKGYNSVQVSDLATTGVLYYTLESADMSATRKMVIVK